MISNSGSDENGKYHGGKAGDQTTNEWRLRTWYDRPWNCVLRHPSYKVANLLSDMSIEAANNDHIGYDQWERKTYLKELKKVGYVPSKITVNCEADCSAGVVANTIGVGYRLGDPKLQAIPDDTYTENMRARFKAAGFTVLTEKKYLISDNYLQPGDILLNDKKHTCVNVSSGKYAVNLSAIQDFVARMYKIVLKRNYDEVGFTNWVNLIASKQSSPEEVAYGFFFSSEFLSFNLSNSEFLNRLYQALLNRKADPSGKAHWTKELESGKSRKYVFDGFVHSEEWKTLLKSYNLA